MSTQIPDSRSSGPSAFRLTRARSETKRNEATGTNEEREEQFSNVKIETDGEIASISFDYAFLANRKKTNWGKEMWKLVRTEKGWKLFSVVYTIRDQ